jgi:hypothetical protein
VWRRQEEEGVEEKEKTPEKEPAKEEDDEFPKDPVELEKKLQTMLRLKNAMLLKEVGLIIQGLFLPPAAQRVD